jgi:2-methylisocitrate lyase-like PEP mutase family enzyme
LKTKEFVFLEARRDVRWMTPRETAQGALEAGANAVTIEDSEFEIPS